MQNWELVIAKDNRMSYYYTYFLPINLTLY